LLLDISIASIKLDVSIEFHKGAVVVSLTAEYALRAVAYLACGNGEPRTVHEISEATQVPADYLSKVLQELSKIELVRSQRGLYGGFTLLRDPQRLSVLEVVEAISPLHRVRACPLQRSEHRPGRLCSLHQLLDDAVASVQRTLGGVTISDLVQAQGDRMVLGLSRRREPQRARGRASSRH
jgi:Rrf2 family protein